MNEKPRFGAGRKRKQPAEKYDNYPVRITIKFSTEAAQWLVDEAEARDVSISSLVRGYVDVARGEGGA